MRILCYINTLGRGGAERVLANLATCFAKDNNEVIFVTSYPVDKEYFLDGKVKRLSLEKDEIVQSRIKRNISRISRLREICKKEKPDILISFMEEPNFRAIIATRGLPVKTLVSVRNDPNKEYAGKVGAFVGKVLLPMADGCVFQTTEAKKWFPKKLQSKSRIIYNAVKEDFYHIDRKPNKGEIITCGRLSEQKNHAMLISAFADVVKQYPYATLKIYGDGILKNDLQKQIDSMGLQGKVFLMGATSTVEKVLETADLFVLSSDYEGMPNALMEAMAAGVPCVSTDCPCGGPRELFGDDIKRKLVPCGDAKQMANKICESLKNRESGIAERKSADLFRPEHINALWKSYLQVIVNKD